MANLDTRNKRGSGIGIDSPTKRIFPNPDGTIAQADRQQTAMKYSGILAAGGSVVPNPYYYRMIAGCYV